MEIAVTLIKDIVTILAMIIAGYIAVFVYFSFAPVVRLSIESEWIKKDYLKIVLEVENMSKIRMRKDFILFQILEHDIKETKFLSEWVPFEKDSIKESIKHWKEPENIFETTRYFYPNDRIKAERLYHFPENSIIHVGLQVKAKLNIFGRIASKIGNQPLRWTTTRIVVKKCT